MLLSVQVLSSRYMISYSCSHVNFCAGSVGLVCYKTDKHLIGISNFIFIFFYNWDRGETNYFFFFPPLVLKEIIKLLLLSVDVFSNQY